MEKIYHNCTYSISGCAFPAMCYLCGFERREIERRKEIPLTMCGDGKARKIISRPVREESEEAET